jgi:hypothetical protein
MKRLFIALLSLLWPTFTSAAVNLTGLWWNPTESGWGVTLDHQPKFLFATFFIYDSDGRATWVIGQLDANTSETAYSGKLYRTTGSPFDKPFSASSTQVTEVGTATIELTDSSHAALTYVLNGVTVSKAIQRQSNKALSILGGYDGISSGSGGPFSTDDTDFAVSLASGGMLIERAAFFGGTCRFSGTPVQMGMRFSIQGTYVCSDFTEGTWKTDDLTLVDDRYFVGTISRTPKGASTSQREIWSAVRLN